MSDDDPYYHIVIRADGAVERVGRKRRVLEDADVDWDLDDPRIWEEDSPHLWWSDEPS